MLFPIHLQHMYSLKERWWVDMTLGKWREKYKREKTASQYNVMHTHISSNGLHTCFIYSYSLSFTFTLFSPQNKHQYSFQLLLTLHQNSTSNKLVSTSQTTIDSTVPVKLYFVQHSRLYYILALPYKTKMAFDALFYAIFLITVRFSINLIDKIH